MQVKLLVFGNYPWRKTKPYEQKKNLIAVQVGIKRTLDNSAINNNRNDCLSFINNCDKDSDSPTVDDKDWVLSESIQAENLRSHLPNVVSVFVYLVETTTIDVDHNVSEEAAADNPFEDAVAMDTITDGM